MSAFALGRLAQVIVVIFLVVLFQVFINVVNNWWISASFGTIFQRYCSINSTACSLGFAIVTTPVVFMFSSNILNLYPLFSTLFRCPVSQIFNYVCSYIKFSAWYLKNHCSSAFNGFKFHWGSIFFVASILLWAYLMRSLLVGIQFSRCVVIKFPMAVLMFY